MLPPSLLPTSNAGSEAPCSLIAVDGTRDTDAAGCEDADDAGVGGAPVLTFGCSFASPKEYFTACVLPLSLFTQHCAGRPF
jgi:hypothetical protein